MFCPKCGTAYPDSFKKCLDCKIPLVSKFPQEPETEPEPEYEPEPECEEFVTVFAHRNQAFIGIIKSVLKNADIEYAEKKEGMHGLLGVQLNKFTEIQVRKDDEEKALSLLSNLEIIEQQNDDTQEIGEFINTLSDEELYEMIELKSHEYIPEAVSIAREEAERRGGLEAIRHRLGIR